MKTVVFISGPSGSGKSTMRKILKQTLGSHFNNRIAGVEVDDIYRFIDPHFNAKNHLEIWRMARESTGHLANGMLKSEIDSVFIFGNTIFSDEQLQDVMKNIHSEHEIKYFHMTLSPNLEALQERLKKRQKTVPDWLGSHLAERQPFLHAKWTNVIDNTTKTPEETLEKIYKLIEKNKDMKSFANKSHPSWLDRIYKRNK